MRPLEDLIDLARVSLLRHGGVAAMDEIAFLSKPRRIMCLAKGLADAAQMDPHVQNRMNETKCLPRLKQEAIDRQEAQTAMDKSTAARAVD